MNYKKKKKNVIRFTDKNYFSKKALLMIKPMHSRLRSESQILGVYKNQIMLNVMSQIQYTVNRTLCAGQLVLHKNRHCYRGCCSEETSKIMERGVRRRRKDSEEKCRIFCVDL